MSAKWMAMLSLVALTALELPARATTVEPRVNLLVRERPSTSARIVDRVPAGKKLILMGRTADGVWAHVDTTKKDGWVPSEQLKGMVKARKANVDEGDEAAPEEEEETSKPMAKRRNVRPEAWVSKSRYHDGEDTKLTVSVNRASIYGRPSAASSEVGILRRGEIVNLVRKSPDKKWILVDIGGGESAWIEAKAVRPGAAAGARGNEEVAEDAPPPPAANKRSAKVVEEVPEEPPPPPPRKMAKAEAPPAEEPPPAPEPPKKKTKKQLAEEKRAAEAERKAAEEADRRRDDEAAPGMAKAEAKNDEPPPPPPAEEERPRKKKKGTKVASRGDMSGIESGNAVVRRNETHGANYVSAGAGAGIAILQTRFTSNGTGQLTNYESQTSALGIGIGLGYARQVHKNFVLGIDGGYAFLGAAGVRYHLNDPATPDPVLGVQSHIIDVGARPALRFAAGGGIQLGLRIGLHAEMNLVQQNQKVPLPSDIVLGMGFGLQLDVPAVFYIANKPFGLHIFGGGIAPANRQQTAGLEEGKASATVGGFAGGSLTYNVYKGLGIDLAALYNISVTHFEGQARRNLTITAADRGSQNFLFTLGLYYAL
jgi:uncharacterized protein YgiM (DUF1202 family)